MTHAIAHVRVGDFDQFVEIFTTRGTAKRSEHGSRGATLFKSSDDPGEAIVVFDWDRADVEAFLADPETQEIMAAGGLQGPPDITFVERVTELGA